MRKRALQRGNNLQHNVPALLERGRESLKALAGAYFVAEVAGQAPGTVEAERVQSVRDSRHGSEGAAFWLVETVPPTDCFPMFAEGPSNPVSRREAVLGPLRLLG